MSIQKTYAVFGLGRYGRAVAAELESRGAEVIAIDIDPAAVEDAAPLLTVCKCADITDRKVIDQLGISNVDTVIVAMASNLEASVMATMLCKEVGVPMVIAKCSSEIHRRILSKVGADRVVFPENDSGVRLARNLLSAGFTDMVELSGKVSMVELEVRDEWAGKSLAELNLRGRYSMNVVALRQGTSVSTAIDPKVPLSKVQTLIVIADTDRLRKLK